LQLRELIPTAGTYIHNYLQLRELIPTAGTYIHNYLQLKEMDGPCSTNGEKRNAYRLLVRKPEGKRPLGRPRRRWVDNIRMDLGEVGWGDVDWISLAKDRNRWRALVNSVLNLRVL
jgi:hypothetical protein